MGSGHQNSTTTTAEANSGKKKQKIPKTRRKQRKKNYNEDFKEVLEVKCIFKENQLHYKVRWLGCNMTHDSWVTKENIKENVPEVLETYQNTLENVEKLVLHPRG